MKTLFSILAFLAFTITASAQSEVFVTKEGAINGYDPVAYFTESKPIVGKKEISLMWKEQMWYFSSTENRDAFKANPEKYEPQFGGYCAYGMSRGYKAKTDPQAWTVVDGKLYINYSKDVQLLWKKDQKNFIIKANEHWAEVKKEKF